MNEKTKTILIVGAWVSYTIFWFIYAEQISNMILTSNILIGLLLYLLGNPVYMLTMYACYDYAAKKGRAFWKRIISSLMIVLGFDMVALPRLGFNDALTNGLAQMTNIGSIIMRFFENTLMLPHTLSYTLMYLIIPIALVLSALELMGATNFIKEIKK